MRLHNVLRFRIHVQNPITVPMMPSPGNQILRMQIAALMPRRRVITMIAHIKPHIYIAIDERQPLSAEFEVAVLVPQCQVRCAGDAGAKGPRAPLLGVVDLEDSRDEGGAGRGRDLVEACFGAGGVEVGAQA